MTSELPNFNIIGKLHQVKNIPPGRQTQKKKINILGVMFFNKIEFTLILLLCSPHFSILFASMK